MITSTNLAADAFDDEGIQNHDLPRIGVANPQHHTTVDHTYSSGTSWAAIFAGASASAALGLILLLLGVGLGLSFVSPWANAGISATSFGVSTILWLTLTQILAYGAGGYLAGRLRTRWNGVAADEVYFRDTAHGFLSWAVATLVTAVLLTSAIGSIIGSGVQAGASVAGGALNMVVSTQVPSFSAESDNSSKSENSSNSANSMAYFISSLFRKNSDSTALSSELSASELSAAEVANTSLGQKAEIATIFMNTIHRGDLPATDIKYVGQLVSERTGLSQLEAEKRVITAYSAIQTKLINAEMVAKDAANVARKATAYTALWLFIALLMGAFVASLAAIYGGRCRDY